MKTGKTLVELATEIQRQSDTKQDLKVQTQALRLHTNGESRLDIPGYTDLVVNDLAHGQVAEHLKIPKPYYDRLRTEHPALLDTNVNTLFRAAPPQERRLLRTLERPDGVRTARAFLSEKFRPLDNDELLEAVLPVLHDERDLQIVSMEVTDRRLYLKVVSPRRQADVKVGDTVQIGAVISNSEVGYGAISVQPLSYRLICLNGAIHNTLGTRRNHVGRILAGEGDSDSVASMLSERALRAENTAFFLKLVDVIKGTFSEAVLTQIVNKMKEAEGARIEGDPVKAVEVLAKKANFNQDERTSVLRHLIEGGSLTMYGLSQAVTRASQDLPDYDRATEFEQVGGNIYELSRSEWREIAMAA
ncbi:MAG TPA: DUF932 domain-containing protein [Chloroflexia bacterium]|jgi:hypothetical protein